MRYRLQRKRESKAGWVSAGQPAALDYLLSVFEADERGQRKFGGHVRIVDEFDREVQRWRNWRPLDGKRKAIRMGRKAAVS